MCVEVEYAARAIVNPGLEAEWRDDAVNAVNKEEATRSAGLRKTVLFVSPE